MNLKQEAPMTRSAISVDAFTVSPHYLWGTQAMILTAGDFESGQFNAMAVAWGSFGTMWDRPIAMCVVRPTRYTYQFIEKYPTFTLCAFPPEYRPAIDLIGSKSGRHVDKIAEAGLTPVAASVAEAPIFSEAELVVECRKIFRAVYEPSQFIDSSIDENYVNKDYHRVYFGEILAVAGVASYARR
jgi:flavin reductase (DIM6/NTAB) family NADH-FMN oxidoreductase RutF